MLLLLPAPALLLALLILPAQILLLPVLLSSFLLVVFCGTGIEEDDWSC